MAGVWTPAEDKALVDARAAGLSFETIGANVLPHRSMHGIRSRAQDLTAVPKGRLRASDARRASVDEALRTTTDSNTAIAERFGVSLDYVHRRIRVMRLVARGYVSPRRFEIPADFVQRSRCATLSALADEFGVSKGTISKWLRACGVQAASRSEAGRAGAHRRWADREVAPASPPKRQIRKPLHGWAAQATVEAPRRDMTLAGRAADECLRRYARCFRADPSGKPNPAGTHWVYGTIVLSSDELVARAEAKGWRADAWKDVA